MIIGIIQARMGSSRLPDKVLTEIFGKNSLLWIYERLLLSKKLDKVVVATSLNPKDDAIETFCLNYGISLFRGSEEDLLDRLYKTCEHFGADHFLRITGDCPLVDPKVVDQLIDYYFSQGDLDYASNNLEASYPHGLDAEIFRVSTFKKVWEEVKNTDLRALAGAYIYMNPDKFKLGSIKYPRNLSSIRVTLDYSEDLELIRKVFSHFNHKMFYLSDLEELYQKNPILFEMNSSHKNHTKQWDCNLFLERNNPFSLPVKRINNDKN